MLLNTNKCVYLRVRTKKGIKYCYCVKQKREIPKNGCYHCVNKEFKDIRHKHCISKKNSTSLLNYLKRIPEKTPENNKKVSDSTYTKVLTRDNYKCRLCGNDKVNELELHHILYRSQRKDLIDEPSNCIMLCGNFSKNKCHMKVHSNKKKYQPMLLELINKDKSK